MKAQQVKRLLPSPMLWKFNPWNPCSVRDSVPTGWPLTSTYVLWHVCYAHAHSQINKCKSSVVPNCILTQTKAILCRRGPWQAGLNVGVRGCMLQGERSQENVHRWVELCFWQHPGVARLFLPLSPGLMLKQLRFHPLKSLHFLRGAAWEAPMTPGFRPGSRQTKRNQSPALAPVWMCPLSSPLEKPWWKLLGNTAFLPRGRRLTHGLFWQCQSDSPQLSRGL